VKGRAANDMAISLNRTTANPAAYPLVLVSYLIGCPTYGSPHTADLVQSYFGYVLSGAGQQAAAKTAGSAPLSAAFSQKAGSQVQNISAK
jgi:phosphate transport system substrate-binding protein